MNYLKVVITDYVCRNLSENKKVVSFKNMVFSTIFTISAIVVVAAIFRVAAIFTVATVTIPTVRVLNMKNVNFSIPTCNYPKSTRTTTILSCPCPQLPPPPSITATSLPSWSRGCLSNDKMVRIMNGNGRKGYNIGLWNCRRGLLNNDKTSTTKMVEVRQFIESKNLHLLCLVESDLHSQFSRILKTNPVNTEEINKVLRVPGYKILLPKSWHIHGQARVLVFASEDLNINIRDIGVENSDLPTISCEIGFGREKKTIVNFFYREFTGGVSGLQDTDSQINRWSRQLKIWKTLLLGNKDVICMGDANLCAKKWLDENYKNKDLSEMIQTLMLEETVTQLVKENTRSEIVQGGEVSASCIDHCYTNSPQKVSEPELLAVGTSDHLGIVVRKFSKNVKSKPNTVKKKEL